MYKFGRLGFFAEAPIFYYLVFINVLEYTNIFNYMNNKELPLPIKLIKRLAPKVGARVVVEPEWGVTAQIVFKNGVTKSLYSYLLDLNGLASSEISTDKGHAKFFMSSHGYPVAKGTTIFSDAWADEMKSNRKIPYAKNYAKKLGYPVVVKPNTRSQGVDVCLVHNDKELSISLKKIFKRDRVAILEQYLPGRDYRIVVLDDEIISVYERIPLSVVGDGKSSIFSLLQKKQKGFILSGRNIKIDFTDVRMKRKLKKQNLSLKSILENKQRIFLLDNANLSSGGDVADATDTIHPEFTKLAIKLVKDMGLRIVGVDVMVTRGDISNNPKDKKACSYYIIEINAAPGLVSHYVKTHTKRKKLIEEMYLKIIKALGKK